MAQYTIEDIEILRKKSGITYEEAVNLLEYHNGSLARALVDLEKNGRIKPEKAAGGAGGTFKGIFTTLYRLRVKVLKGSVTIVNLSCLFLLLLLLTAPHIVIIGLILTLLLGYRITGERNSADFASDSFDSMFDSAKRNVRHTVNDFSKSFAQEKKESDGAPQPGSAKAGSEGAASGTRPVNVQFPKGGPVDVREDEDGYHEADIR